MRIMSIEEQIPVRCRARSGTSLYIGTNISVRAVLVIAITALLLWTSRTQAQVPVDQLDKPPAGAKVFTILSTSGTNGKAFLWTTRDGAHMSRESILLRGQVWELDQSLKFGSDGMPSAMIVRGVTPQGDAAETFEVHDGKASWKSPVDAGSHSYNSAALYVPEGGTSSGSTQLLIETLLASPDKSIALLPGGRARAERLTDVVVGEGAQKKIVTAWAITGLSPSPLPVWTSEDNKFFGTVGGLSILPVGYEHATIYLDLLPKRN